MRGFAFGEGGEEVEGVERGGDCITALAKIFCESGRRSHNEQMLLRQLSPYHFLSEETKKTLASLYLKNLDTIRDNTPSRQTLSREYADVDWRLDVEVSRRSAFKIAKPVFSFRVDTTGGPTMTNNNENDG